MANWISKITAPEVNVSTPYDWSSSLCWECTWYAYYRVMEGSGLNQAPCWQTGSGSSGAGLWNNAKTWLAHFRDPWEVKGLDYQCQPGDIIVFDGNAGHVVVVELVNNDGSLVISDCNLIGGNHNYGVKYDYEYGNVIYGLTAQTGVCLGALHNPNITSSADPDKPKLIPLLKRKKRIRTLLRRF